MTEKLYEKNVLLQQCTGKVLSCREDKGKFLVELDQTVFFPEGGGQLSDRGWLDEAQVSHVSVKDGRIYHECSKAFAAGAEVQCRIDWAVRLDRMQQHTGEHLLSYAFWKLYGLDNVGFHMNETEVTIDLNGEVTEEQLHAAEILANQLVWENRAVRTFYIDDIEELKVPMRKFNSGLKGNLRIVAVDGADVCTCCGTHTPFTGMVGSIKMIRSSRHKQGSRIEFLCGRRALKDAADKNDILLKTAAEFSVKPLEVFDKSLQLKHELEACRQKLKAQKKALLEAEFAKLYQQSGQIGSLKTVMLFLEDGKDIKLLSSMAEAHRDALCLAVAAEKDRISYGALSEAADCRCCINIFNEIFSGRGGGKQDFAQGSSAYYSDWKEKAGLAARKITALVGQ